MVHSPSDQIESATPHAGDAALVEACLARVPGAWERLVRTYASLVFSIPRRLGLSREEAEDVSQGVFTALLGSLPSLRDGQSLAKWLIVVAKRQSWKVIRARQAQIDETSQHEAHTTISDDAEEVWQRRQAVREALATLGGRCQDLLTALFLRRSSPDYAEVSASLGIPVGSIGPTRNRCLKRLMDILGAIPGTSGLWNVDDMDSTAGPAPRG